jgi:ATP-dependent Lon protease
MKVQSLVQYGYSTKHINVEDDSTILYLISRIRKEKGVRDLKRGVQAIIKKLHFLKSTKMRSGKIGMDISFDVSTKLNINVSQKIIITNRMIDLFIQNNQETEHLSMYM